MMKRMFCLLLTVLMGVSCIFASAEDAQDNSADALTLAELQAFAARMQTLAMASTPLNDPADAKTEDVAASIMALKAGAPDTQAELLALKQRMAERDADEEVQKALKAGKITSAQSEWAKSYALKDMEGFKGFVDKAPVVVPQGKLDLKDAPAASNSDEVDVAILKNMGVSMEDVKKYNKKED